LKVRRLVTLQGDFSFDAIAPDGSWLYVIHYLSPTDPTRYRVQAFDLQHGRLLAKPIVDPKEPGDKMRGNPLSRAVSADGRWAYTLYDGGGGTPFVHALDTVARSAHCIDLDELAAGTNLWQLRLGIESDGKHLVVRDGGAAKVLIDRLDARLRSGADFANAVNWESNWQLATPQTALDRPVPPTLLVQGGADQIVGPEHSRSLAADLAAANDQVALVEIPWGGHGFDAISWGPGGQIALEAMLRFLGLVAPVGPVGLVE